MARLLDKVATGALSLSLLGCSDIVINVDKKAKGRPAPTATTVSQEKNSDEIDLRAVHSYLQDVDHVKADSVSWLLEELMTGDLRASYRKTLRKFRDGIINDAANTNNYRSDLFAVLNDFSDLEGDARCTDLEKNDLFTYHRPEEISRLMIGALFTSLNALDPQTIAMNYSETDKNLIAQVDDQFRTKMGVDVKELKYEITEAEEKKTTARSLIWRVNMEAGEEAFVSADSLANDEFAVKFTFSRIEVAGEDDQFELDILVAKGLLDDAPTGDQYYMRLGVDKATADLVESTIELGMSDGTTETTSYSRKMSYQKLAGETFQLEDIAHFEMDGEEPVTRSAILDLDNLTKCLP